MGRLPDAPDDEQIEQLLAAHVKPGMTVADVGAHAGRYVLEMAQVAEHVIAVEPNPVVAAQLKENVRGLPVKVLQFAALDRDGMVGLWCNPENGGDTRVYGAGPSEHRVRARRLAPLIPRLDFALLDCQGTEHLALKGMASKRPPVCVVEMWPEGLDAQGTTETAVLKAYGQMGYQVSELDRPAGGYWNLLLQKF